MAADLISAMQDAGGTLAQTLASGNAVGSRTRYGTVKKNNGTTLDVELCGATLAAVPMLTTCVGAAAGDRCILTIDGALVTVTGIIANAGNAPYVKWHFGSSVITVNNSPYGQMWTKAEFVTAFGVEPNDFSKYCISMYNGDRDANGALVNPSVSLSSNVVYAHFSYSFTGSVRINWSVGVYVTG
jgi:hypothetical protein